ncbi:MAG TPA: polysaccharide deacetylase family protein [Actinomycetes bacterium]|nr:polysaccharide deacetylase family protein [Actinomycetes bacterium]
MRLLLVAAVVVAAGATLAATALAGSGRPSSAPVPPASVSASSVPSVSRSASPSTSAAKAHGAETPVTALPYRVATCGDTSGRVLITVDDYPYRDPKLVYQLAYRATRDWHIGMIGFPISKFTRSYRAKTGVDLVKRARHYGMWMGNHTYDHKLLTTLTTAQIRREISGGVASTLLRPPYGAYDATVTKVATSLGYRLCTWNIDPLDWQPGRGGHRYRSVASIRYVIRHELAEYHLRPGRSIVIDGHYMTNFPKAIPGIIVDLRARGYRICRPPRGPTTRTIPDPLPC